MRGHFNVAVLDAGGRKDEDFIAAKKAGKLQELLDRLRVDQQAQCDNMITHWMASSFIMRIIGHGFPNAPWPIYSAYIFPWMSISLMTTDSEPAYTDAYGWYGGFHSHYDNIGDSTGSKGWDYTAEAWVVNKTTGGKEEIYARFRWLWLPSEGNSNNIRSIGIFGSEYDNQGTGSEDRYQVARVRLKHPTTGLPVILIKNFNQVFVIEYTVFLVSI